MNSQPSPSPDVLVLGMPSSGKTVFLSVLGREFMLVADDSDARPLGFRMRAIGRSTLDAVSRNYAKILGGEWPASTVAGSVTPLKWDVFTGTRKVFTLTSMDVSGESFVKAFNDGGKGAVRHANSDGDGLLDMANAGGGQQSVADEAAELLRERAASAKVICFFVNIAASRRGILRRDDGVRAGQRDIDAARNYEAGIANICAFLDEHPELRSKALVVLTQAHRHQSEIEKAGGPAAYLGRIAPNLRQSVAEFSIPVIAVSAINESDSDDDFDDDDGETGNIVPETIESDGLFGFLLVVAGMIPDARLASVKDAYLQYLADKSRSLQLPSRTILERLPLIEAYARSGIAFEKACRDYLDDVSNVNSADSDELPWSTVALYRRRTLSDKDILAATTAWRRRLEIDMTWDRVFRRIVRSEAKMLADGSNDGDVCVRPSAREIVEMVRGEVGGTSDVDALPLSAIYGFVRDELDPARDAASEDDWVMKNLDDYRRRLAGDLDDYMKAFSEAKEAFASVKPESGMSFNVSARRVEGAILRCQRLAAAFREKTWLADDPDGLPQIAWVERETEKLQASLSDARRRHEEWLNAIESDRRDKAVARVKAQKEAQRVERERKDVRRKRMRKWMLLSALSLLAATAVCAFLFKGRPVVTETGDPDGATLEDPGSSDTPVEPKPQDVVDNPEPCAEGDNGNTNAPDEPEKIAGEVGNGDMGLIEGSKEPESVSEALSNEVVSATNSVSGSTVVPPIGMPPVETNTPSVVVDPGPKPGKGTEKPKDDPEAEQNAINLRCRCEGKMKRLSVDYAEWFFGDDWNEVGRLLESGDCLMKTKDYSTATNVYMSAFKSLKEFEATMARIRNLVGVWMSEDVVFNCDDSKASTKLSVHSETTWKFSPDGKWEGVWNFSPEGKRRGIWKFSPGRKWEDQYVRNGRWRLAPDNVLTIDIDAETIKINLGSYPYNKTGERELGSCSLEYALKWSGKDKKIIVVECSSTTMPERKFFDHGKSLWSQNYKESKITFKKVK